MLKRSRHYRPIDWDTWIFMLKDLWHQPNLMYLELGVFEGRSLLMIMETILTHPTCAAFGVDLWAPGSLDERSDPEVIYQNAQKNLARYPNVTLIREASADVMLSGRFAPESIDLAYIDADHLDLAVHIDITLLWPLLKTGGFLIADDYGEDYKRNAKKKGPRRAIDHFRQTHPHTILHAGYQLLMRKEPHK